MKAIALFLVGLISNYTYASTVGECLDKVINAAEIEISKDNFSPGNSTYYVLQAAKMSFDGKVTIKVQFETSGNGGKLNRAFEASPQGQSCIFKLIEITKR